jgi:hypothetical protein
LEVNEARRLREMEDENGWLKRIVAHQALALDALKVVLSKKWYARWRSEKRRGPRAPKAQSASPGLAPTRREPEHCEELTGAVKPRSAERAKQLLRAVRGEG